MFYTISKLFWFVAAPSSVIAIAFALAFVAWFFNWRRLARGSALAGAALYLIFGVAPTGTLLALALENRFARPPADAPAPDGIIVLGGAMDDQMLVKRGALVLGPSGTRMSEAVALSRRYPQAKFVFTGGSADLAGHTHAMTEAEAARRFFEAMGVAPGRTILEDHSRNTFENAVFTRDLVKPKPGERWLLVTSATHMPRSMGIFRQAGFEVVAWPAHYFTYGSWRSALQPNLQPSDGLWITDIAVREWIGLIVYRLTGKSNALFPAP